MERHVGNLKQTSQNLVNALLRISPDKIAHGKMGGENFFRRQQFNRELSDFAEI